MAGRETISIAGSLVESAVKERGVARGVSNENGERGRGWMDGWKEGVLEDFDSPMIPAAARVMIPQYPPMIGSSSQLSSPPLFSSPRRPLFIHLSLPPPSFLILLARRTPLYHPLHVQPSSDDVSFPRSFFARPKSSGYHVPLSLSFLHKSTVSKR